MRGLDFISILGVAMSLLVTGSIGIDNVTTPFGEVHDVIGGSAVYFSRAAAHFGKVRLVGVVGDDFPRKFEQAFKHKNIDIAGLERRAGSKTFRWSGSYDPTMNEATTTAVDLNVLAEAAPKIPLRYADSRVVFLAATHPTLQMELLAQIKKPSLVVADTRDLWIKNYHKELLASLKKIDGIVLNDLEARLLAGTVNLVACVEKIRRLLKPSGPRMVVLKKGEHGSLAATGSLFFPVPAFPSAKVVDPTGAGDSFAGGMLGYLARKPTFTDRDFKHAILAGTIMASFTIEGFSIAGINRATASAVAARTREFTRMLKV
jgi:sugar/nucleoside kinase (ribokinase family)